VQRGKDVKVYRRLREGDVVERGQMLARLEDRLPQLAVDFAKAKVLAARADHAAAVATYEEATKRVDRIETIRRQNPRLVSEEDHAAAVLTRVRHLQEAIAREQGVKLAEVEFQQAEAELDLYVVRSPVRGIIQRIEKRAGEGIRALDTLMEIRVLDKK
jgi:multidrug resistance efflux pump